MKEKFTDPFRFLKHNTSIVNSSSSITDKKKDSSFTLVNYFSLEPVPTILQ